MGSKQDTKEGTGLNGFLGRQTRRRKPGAHQLILPPGFIELAISEPEKLKKKEDWRTPTILTLTVEGGNITSGPNR